jgi:hypothetical protein
MKITMLVAGLASLWCLVPGLVSPLMAQTYLDRGLGTNRVNVPNSATVAQMDFPIDPAAPAVFYRLVSP